MNSRLELVSLFLACFEMLQGRKNIVGAALKILIKYKKLCEAIFGGEKKERKI